MFSGMSVIQVANLCKQYGEVQAVQDISFTVDRGEIFGIIGPNGAGKTTTVECLEGLRQPTSGSLRILDMDPHKDAHRLKPHIGIQLQESVLPDRIKVKEALRLFAALYHRTPREQHYLPLMEELGLTQKLNSTFDTLSGGQKQRLSIALALVHDPDIVFFDELTTGLDPQARRAIWQMVEKVRDMGKTVVLVTHFMEEAERLCDRVAIIDHGQLMALDSPRQLVRKTHRHFHVQFYSDHPGLPALLAQLPEVSETTDNQGKISVTLSEVQHIATIITWLTEQQIPFFDLAIRQPNLEDVFLELTGRALRD